MLYTSTQIVQVLCFVHSYLTALTGQDTVVVATAAVSTHTAHTARLVRAVVEWCYGVKVSLDGGMFTLP